jgi:hypothetical protein
MLDDPRIKRVLKRYPKDDQFPDGSFDVSTYGDAALLEACRREDVDEMSRPIELDAHALMCFSQRMGIEFDCSQFDYFLHSYVRPEHMEAYYGDPTVTSRPAPEDGLPAKIPLKKGLRWFAVRPKNGNEQFEAFECEDSK